MQTDLHCNIPPINNKQLDFIQIRNYHLKEIKLILFKIRPILLGIFTK